VAGGLSWCHPGIISHQILFSSTSWMWNKGRSFVLCLLSNARMQMISYVYKHVAASSHTCTRVSTATFHVKLASAGRMLDYHSPHIQKHNNHNNNIDNHMHKLTGGNASPITGQLVTFIHWPLLQVPPTIRRILVLHLPSVANFSSRDTVPMYLLTTCWCHYVTFALLPFLM